MAMMEEEITLGAAVTPETDLVLSGLVDSIAVIHVVVWIEEYLETQIDPVNVVLENFQTVALIDAYVKTL